MALACRSRHENGVDRDRPLVHALDAQLAAAAEQYEGSRLSGPRRPLPRIRIRQAEHDPAVDGAADAGTRPLPSPLLEFIRRMTPSLAHSTPFRSRRSLAKVSTKLGELHIRYPALSREQEYPAHHTLPPNSPDFCRGLTNRRLCWHITPTQSGLRVRKFRRFGLTSPTSVVSSAPMPHNSNARR